MIHTLDWNLESSGEVVWTWSTSPFSFYLTEKYGTFQRSNRVSEWGFFYRILTIPLWLLWYRFLMYLDALLKMHAVYIMHMSTFLLHVWKKLFWNLDKRIESPDFTCSFWDPKSDSFYPIKFKINWIKQNQIKFDLILPSYHSWFEHVKLHNPDKCFTR